MILNNISNTYESYVSAITKKGDYVKAEDISTLKDSTDPNYWTYHFTFLNFLID
jgi:hypothetical protein